MPHRFSAILRCSARSSLPPGSLGPRGSVRLALLPCVSIVVSVHCDTSKTVPHNGSKSLTGDSVILSFPVVLRLENQRSAGMWKPALEASVAECSRKKERRIQLAKQARPNFDCITDGPFTINEARLPDTWHNFIDLESAIEVPRRTSFGYRRRSGCNILVGVMIGKHF